MMPSARAAPAQTPNAAVIAGGNSTSAQTEAALQHALSLLRAALESTADGILVVSSDGRITFRNQRFCEIWRIPTEMHGSHDGATLLGYALTQVRNPAGLIARVQELNAEPERESFDVVELTDGRTLERHSRPQIVGERIVGRVWSFRDVTLRKQAEAEIENLALYDPLTQLPNRRLLRDRLRQAVAANRNSGSLGAILFVDLDHFKNLNDTLGYSTGDSLLVAVAARLRGCLRAGDTLSRLGGDEFVVIAGDLGVEPPKAMRRAQRIAENIRGAIAEPYDIGGHECFCAASVGITIFRDQDDSVDELLRRAEVAMFEAKSSGRNAIRTFEPAMQAALFARAALASDLYRALRSGQFLLYFQPKVTRDGRIVGAEALLRWAHPEQGLVSPAQFIPLAEETGLINPIGEWVLEAACYTLAAWANYPATRNLELAINVSGRQFRERDFVDRVASTLDRTGASSSRLKLELTESLVLEDIADTVDKMRRIKSRNIGLSMDDFGTGHSSLAKLATLPLDEVKIDRSFVAGLDVEPDMAAIVRCIIGLAESLGLAIVAEGVETTEQLDFLLRHRCTLFQGHLLSPPLSLTAFERLLTSASDTRVLRSRFADARRRSMGSVPAVGCAPASAGC